MGGWKNVWNDIKAYKFNSILFRNFLTTVLLLMVPIGVVHLLVYAYNDEMLREEIERTNMSELENVRDAIDNSLLGLENVSLQLAGHSDYSSIMKEEFTYPMSTSLIQKIYRIQESMRTVQMANTYFGSILLYLERSNFVITSSNGGQINKYDTRWWMDSYQRQKTSESGWIEFLHGGTQEDTEVSIAQFRQLPIFDVNRQGILLISIDMNRLKRLLGLLYTDQRLYILDSAGNIVYASQHENLHRLFADTNPQVAALVDHVPYSDIVKIEESDQVISTVSSAYRDWKYVSIVPLNHYYPKQVRFNEFMTLLVTLAVVSSLLFAIVLSLQSYRPISGILSLLHSGDKASTGVRQGKLNELKLISATIANSNEKRRELEQELKHRYELLQKSQAIALQAQIKPHFLYNTLESINLRAMRLTKGKNDVSEMIQTLSRLLRLSLMTGEDMISLRTELEHARLYIQIRQMRLDEQLEVTWLVNDDILDCAMIKLTLQPVLENAINHGIGPSPRSGVISIIGYAKREMIVLRIKDNGVGMSRTVVDRVNQGFLQSPINENESIGLRNVNQRIKLMFGSEYGLRLVSKAGKGTIVELRLPKRKRT
ncbi:sensor histidine kinase [Paenibacillus sp. PAMC21692]|uniref:sensor histidine kinase n=1 Tax=Paenibacillus sp. PAMC21692 TaxID=2762320 RepID=UPI00164E10B7|nr:sensor histidine kinase [Paenibacillus sp. PAMC21692]QNK58434.1 sensor histidine kinase [Paenibacillus sp. PAMC21692]